MAMYESLATVAAEAGDCTTEQLARQGSHLCGGLSIHAGATRPLSRGIGLPFEFGLCAFVPMVG